MRSRNSRLGGCILLIKNSWLDTAIQLLLFPLSLLQLHRFSSLFLLAWLFVVLLFFLECLTISNQVVFGLSLTCHFLPTQLGCTWKLDLPIFVVVWWKYQILGVLAADKKERTEILSLSAFKREERLAFLSSVTRSQVHVKKSYLLCLVAIWAAFSLGDRFSSWSGFIVIGSAFDEVYPGRRVQSWERFYFDDCCWPRKVWDERVGKANYLDQLVDRGNDCNSWIWFESIAVDQEEDNVQEEARTEEEASREWRPSNQLVFIFSWLRRMRDFVKTFPSKFWIARAYRLTKYVALLPINSHCFFFSTNRLRWPIHLW